MEFLITNLGRMQGPGVTVKVEVRQSSTASFGRGVTQVMPFRRFLDRFDAGDSSVYMTAQNVGVAADGHPELFAAPVTQLAADVLLQPAVMGGLIPQQLNMWMGHAVDGARGRTHQEFQSMIIALQRQRFTVYGHRVNIPCSDINVIQTRQRSALNLFRRIERAAP